ncbi:MAG: serine--tRNA ligase [Flavobacteriales bacterium]|nr:serine--tRNA ligase [Flavobacteriales bacterium]MBL6872592.1 serine--tRNA ligase [Flavobacteriales bacterium]
MLQINYIREHKTEALERLKKRNIHADELFNEIISKDDLRKDTQSKLDNILSQSNQIAKEIGQYFKNGEKEKAEEAKLKTVELKQTSKSLGELLNKVSDELTDLLTQIPNVPHESVPSGKSANDNETVSQEGDIPKLHENALPHWELAQKYDLIDFELGNKISGAGFPVYKGKGAKLQRALINYFLDKNTAAGYQEIQPPHLVNEASGFGTGQLPDKEGQMYHITVDNLYLIPTAEVPVTNIFRDVIVKSEDFPIKYTAYTPCFRREAGSYGKDVRGLNRLHQFDKVEIVQVQKPEQSYQTLDSMVEHVTQILRELELPFRILKLCGGDMSFTSALTYDMEVYSAAQERWLEVSSISNFESYQANRLKLRYKDENKNNILCHTLNGSALALPRIVASLLENNQDEKGIRIPKVLVPYTGFEYIY